MISKLPHKIKLSSKEPFSVVIVPRFDDGTTEGECDYDRKTIRLVTSGRSDKTIVSTLLHECIHYIDHSFNIGLTESQVMKLEEAIVLLFKCNHSFSRLFFSTFVKRMKK